MILKYERAADLPSEWDDAAGGNIYLTRAFLAFMEEADDLEKCYFGVYSDGKLDTIFETVLQPEFNLAMFMGKVKKIKATMIYVPLSVTRPGISYKNCFDEAVEFIRKLPGYKVFLNLPDVSAKGFAKGFTCPKCILDIKWKTFDEYLNSLRSNYRYRYKKALAKSAPLSIRYLKNGDEFTKEMYTLYEHVHDKSIIRVEKLTERFFHGEFFKIFVLEEQGVPRGFVQLLEIGDELVFEFVGVDYSVNSKYDIYISMLLEIIRYGIENGFKSIDFGQTADDAKLKLGCRHVPLYALLGHSNSIKNCACKLLAPKLQCKPFSQRFDVFKEEKL